MSDLKLMLTRLGTTTGISILVMCIGCGDYVTKSDLEESEASHQRQVAELQEDVDGLRADVNALEVVFVSDVVLNTEVRSDSGTWPDVFGGSVSTESSWRFLETVEGEVQGGYTVKWTNNAQSNITVNVARLVFEDANGIQIAEELLFGEQFPLDSGQTRERTGNFSFFVSVSAANQVTRMSIWASFSER